MLLPVAIPSYNRPQLIAKKTLKYLKDSLYPTHLITIFVADEDQKNLYESIVPAELYGQLVVGVKGLFEQRRFISSYYPEDSYILQMDDDLKGLVGSKSLTELVYYGYQLLIEKNAALFGVMPNSDKRRLKDDYTTHLSHIIGSFFIVKNDPALLPTGTELEDYERSVLSLIHYGNVIRYRGSGVDTNYGKTPGGLQEEGRYERINQGVIRMLNLYPQYCKRILKGDRPDIRLDFRAKGKI